MGTGRSSYRPVKLAKNNHIPTAIDQFSKISFSAKQFSKIMQDKISFPAHWFFFKNFFKIFFEYFKKNFSQKKIAFWKNFKFFFKESIFENCFSENLIFKNWFMSVGIRLTVFEIAIFSKADIRLDRSKFLCEDLDEYYCLKVLEISFENCTYRLQVFEVGQKIIISQLPLINFRRYHFLQKKFLNHTK